MTDKEQMTGEGLRLIKYIMQCIVWFCSCNCSATRIADRRSSYPVRTEVGGNDTIFPQRPIMYISVSWIYAFFKRPNTGKFDSVTSTQGCDFPALGKRFGFMYFAFLNSSS